jgi:subtilisin-like proprotein convertase family protein
MSEMFADTMDQSVRRRGIARRTLLGRVSLLAAASCLSLGLPVAGPLVAAKPHSGKAKSEKKAEIEKSKGGKTVTRTFSSPNAVLINDNTTADPYPATIQVSGFKKGKVIDVNVVLRGLNHSFPDHIDAVLMAPSGAAAVLMSDAGGSADAASLTLTLDDEAAAALPDGSGLATGAYKPGNYGAADTYPSLGTSPTAAILSLLDGGNPNGEWRLYVVDDAATNLGAFSGGWDLVLTVKLEKKKKHRRGGKK